MQVMSVILFQLYRFVDWDEWREHRDIIGAWLQYLEQVLQRKQQFMQQR